ncbi:MAG: pyridoxal phosphate-dependent aminotransferase [Deltaproteobacteria bacterium]|nr:pyridoxal phosphate-dependent aminotransferase [Deltaproteobacteria bacterium]
MTLNNIEKCYRQLRKEGREILRLFDGNPNHHGLQFPPELLIQEYRKYFENEGYDPDSKGLLVAREVISNYYGSSGFAVGPDQILLTPGTSESFFYIFSILTQPGDNILVPNPAYPLFDEIARLAKIELKHYQLMEEKGWGIDFEDLESKIDQSTRAIAVISPHNPTGMVATAKEMEKIVALAKEHDLAILSDEVYADFIFDKSDLSPTLSLLRRGGPSLPLWFTLNGISKMFALPALKLGWIAVSGDPKRVAVAVDQLETVADTFLSTHMPIQRALPALFREGKEFLSGYREEVEGRKKLAVQILQQSDRIRFVEPKGGFYLMAEVCRGGPVWPPLKNGQTHRSAPTEEQFIIELMRQTGVFVHPGYFFDYEKGVNFIFSFLAEPKVLKKGLTQLVEFIESL